jgi:hypothetical protein
LLFHSYLLVLPDLPGTMAITDTQDVASLSKMLLMAHLFAEIPRPEWLSSGWFLKISSFYEVIRKVKTKVAKQEIGFLRGF